MSITLDVTDYFSYGDHVGGWSSFMAQAQEHHDAGQPYVTEANEGPLQAAYQEGWGIAPESAKGLTTVELEAMLLQDVSGAANEIAEDWTDGDGRIDWDGYSESVGTLSADPAGNIYIHFSA